MSAEKGAIVGLRILCAFGACVAAGVFLGCAQPPKVEPHGLPEKIFPMPAGTRAQPRRSPEALGSAIVALYPTLGGYPPRYQDEAHRDQLYARWTDIWLDATAYPPGSLGDEEARLFLLAELYRMGHNLDVRDAGPEANRYVTECLSLFSRSRACNLSAARFLLSIAGGPGSDHLDRAQVSLEVLREEYRPVVDEETEAGFVFLYLHRLDHVAAKAQIDYYLTHFPDTQRAADFQRMRTALDRPIRRRQQP